MDFPEPKNMVSRERYMRDPHPIRLGNLASNMAHIRTTCTHESQQMLIARFIRESMWFMEWAAPEADPEIGSELVDIQIELACWYRGWDTIWNNPERCAAAAEQAGKWSERILGMSGLLNIETYIKYNIPSR